MSESWRKSREIIERIVVEGDLILLTPTSLGNGDSDGLTDMSLLRDAVDGSALLTGTSIAGALRNYLRERRHGFEVTEAPASIIRQLFGYHEENDSQSLLIIDDARSVDEQGRPEFPATELRDGVRIDGKTRTAYVDKNGKGSKFDFELLEAGTTFKLRFELLITRDQLANQDKLLSAFAIALQGFEKGQNSESGEIHLGARKRRGYGECKVERWKAKRFVFGGDDGKKGLLAWLNNDFSNLVEKTTIAEVFHELYKSESLSLQPFDQREYFELKACFALYGSILIRSGSKLADAKGNPLATQPDTVHLRSKRNGNPTAIISGTSLAGVLRHRAVKICNTLKTDKGKDFVEKIFGADMEALKKRNRDTSTNDQPFASRLEVKEAVIDESKTNSLVQARVKIDRFTGGAYGGALFDAAPVFAKSDKQTIELSLKLRKPTQGEIGLLLLLLKDLWTSDLPIGGESSIGRGRLKGISANLHYRKSDADFWRICLEGAGQIKAACTKGNLPEDETETSYLNNMVGQLKAELGKHNANH